MHRHRMVGTRIGLVVSCCAWLWVLTGCTVEPPKFQLNFQGKERSALKLEQQQILVDTLDGLFGQPDTPFVLEESEIDYAKIALASGPTGQPGVVLTTTAGDVFAGTKDGTVAEKVLFTDRALGPKEILTKDIAAEHPQLGLYRQHCMHCHGISGDGLGPTAIFLNPYPRDFRRGMFKFVSTSPTVGKPTRADLKRTLVEGIPGTSMPSFALLKPEEIDALVEYVTYLSIRGETETILASLIADDEELDHEIVIEEALLGSAGLWMAAENAVMVPPPVPREPLADRVAKGKTLYFSATTKCAGCHGPMGVGDGLDKPNYDVWNEGKEKTPELYTLPIQAMPPRNLRSGVYRGGRRPLDLYRRLSLGIIPSKMPSFQQSLKPEEIWYLVDYVQSLPYEGSSAAPAADRPTTTSPVTTAAISPAPLPVTAP